MHKIKYIIITILALFIMVSIAHAQSGRSTNVGIFGWDADNVNWTRMSYDSEYGLKVRSIGTDYPHHEVHGGNSYCVSFNATLGNGGATTFLINAPAGDAVGHIVVSVRSSGESNVKFYEDVTVSALGTDLSEDNHNRNSANTSTIDFTRAPTITSLGTELTGFERHVGAGQQSGGESRGTHEWILKAGSLSIVNAVSEAAGNDVTLSVDFYISDDAF